MVYVISYYRKYTLTTSASSAKIRLGKILRKGGISYDSTLLRKVCLKGCKQVITLVYTNDISLEIFPEDTPISGENMETIHDKT